jgi:DNA-binding beta-propeller fold protein YncE
MEGRARRAVAMLALVAVLGCERIDEGGLPDLVVGGRGSAPGEFVFPRALAVDPRDGRFWVADRKGRIQLFDSSGRPLALWSVPETELGAPAGMALDRDGTLLVSDSHYQRVLRFGSAGKGPGQLTFGRDVAVDSQGNVYVGDYGGDNDRVQKLSGTGEFILEWGRQGAGPGEFSKVHGMAIERRGGLEHLLVVDQGNHRVQRFDLDGRFVSSFGSLGDGLGELRYPSGIAVADDGSIYVSEWGNHRVQKFTPDGESLGVWGRPGRAPGELSQPWDVAAGAGDRVYAVDYGNHRVQVFRWTVASARRSVAAGLGGAAR